MDICEGPSESRIEGGLFEEVCYIMVCLDDSGLLCFCEVGCASRAVCFEVVCREGTFGVEYDASDARIIFIVSAKKRGLPRGGCIRLLWTSAVAYSCS